MGPPAPETRRTGRSRSEVFREAVKSLEEKDREESSGHSLYERVAHLIGSVAGGPADLSEHTGARVAEKLQKRRQ